MAKLLEVQGVTKRFSGLTAVDDLSFYLEEGEVLGLMGPNGSGKTTIFNVIMGEYLPDSGRIFFEGKDITDYPVYQRVKLGIARTYQVPRPFLSLQLLGVQKVRVNVAVPHVHRGGSFAQGHRRRGESFRGRVRLQEQQVRVPG